MDKRPNSKFIHLQSKNILKITRNLFTSNKVILVEARDIFERYVMENSDSQLNIENWQRNAVEKILNKFEILDKIENIQELKEMFLFLFLTVCHFCSVVGFSSIVDIHLYSVKFNPS